MRLLSLLLIVISVAACGDIDSKPNSTTNSATTSSNGETPDAGSDVGAVDAEVQAVPCAADSDCGLGSVCGADDLCVVATCDFCTSGQICYRSAQNPAGSCSAGGNDIPVSGDSCLFDEDCPLGAVCTFDGICIVAACEFCSETQVCYRSPGLPDGSCSAAECVADDDCADGICVEGICQ